MLSNLEALLALADAGTTTRAAARLRITQSAVSKRIGALQAELGVELVRRHGRRLRLTPAGERLIERARPLLAELRGALAGEQSDAGGLVTIGVSESILASWGAPALAAAGGELHLGAHRSPVALERVRAGEYMLALVAGRVAPSPDLITELALEEPMAIVPAGERRFRLRRGRAVEVISIEPASSTWRALEPGIERLRRDAGVALRVARSNQSFACIVQMARAGLGHGLVPRALAESMGVPRAALIPVPGLARPVALVGRPSTLARPAVAAFCARLAAAIRRVDVPVLI